MTNLAKTPLRTLPLPARLYQAKSKLINNLYHFLADQDLRLDQMSTRTGASQKALNELFNGTVYDGYSFDELIEYLFRADDRAQITVRRVHFVPGHNSDSTST